MPAEAGRTISPTVYTTDEFEQRLRDKRTFLKRVLAGPTIVLSGTLPDE